MTEITVTKNDAGQRADRFLTKAYPNLSLPLICKLMRKKRIKLNGARTEPNVKLSEGDVFRFYLSDELLDTGGREKTADFRGGPAGNRRDIRGRKYTSVRQAGRNGGTRGQRQHLRHAR